MEFSRTPARRAARAPTLRSPAPLTHPARRRRPPRPPADYLRAVSRRIWLVLADRRAARASPGRSLVLRHAARSIRPRREITIEPPEFDQILSRSSSPARSAVQTTETTREVRPRPARDAPVARAGRHGRQRPELHRRRRSPGSTTRPRSWSTTSRPATQPGTNHFTRSRSKARTPNAITGAPRTARSRSSRRSREARAPTCDRRVEAERRRPASTSSRRSSRRLDDRIDEIVKQLERRSARAARTSRGASTSPLEHSLMAEADPVRRPPAARSGSAELFPKAHARRPRRLGPRRRSSTELLDRSGRCCSSGSSTLAQTANLATIRR